MGEFSESGRVVDTWFEGTVTGSNNTFTNHGRIVDLGQGNRYTDAQKVQSADGKVTLANGAIPGLPSGMKVTFHKY